MFLDDLLAATGSDALSRLRLASHDGKRTAAWIAQEQLTNTLLGAAAGASRRKRLTQQVRRRLISEINLIASRSIASAVAALAELEAADCRFSIAEDERSQSGRSKRTGMPAFEYYPVILCRSLLRISELMHLPDAPKYSFIEEFAKQDGAHFFLQDVINELQAVRGMADMIQNARRLQRDIVQVHKDLSKNVGVAVNLAPETLADVPPALRPFTSFLPRVPPDADNDVLTDLAGRYQRLGRAMLLPRPLLASAPKAKLLRWGAAWSTYEAHGQALALLGSWIRNIGPATVSKRCSICYRHVDKSNHLRCSEHRRSSKKRPDVLKENTGATYLKVVKKFLRLDSSDTSYADVFLADGFEEKVPPILHHLGWPKELLRQAVTLGTILARLEPFLGSELNTMVSRHFMGLLEHASKHSDSFASRSHSLNQPHSISEPLSFESLDIRTFLLTWYGKDSWVLSKDDPYPGLGLDPAHPFLKDKRVIFSRLKIDFLHHRAWLEAKREVAGLYPDGSTIIAMRSQLNSRGRKRTYASIAAELGCSIETVRQMVLRASGATPMSSKPRRIRGRNQGSDKII